MTLLFKNFSKFGTILLAGYVFWLGWTNLGPRKPEVGPVRRKLADKAVAEVVEDIRQHRGDVQDVVLIHFGNDSTDYFTNRLRSVIEQHGTLNLRDTTFLEKLREKSNLRHPSCGTLQDAVLIGKSRGASGVLFGNLLTFESHASGAAVEVDYTLADCRAGKVIHSGKCTKNISNSILSGMSAAVVEENVRSVPWLKRTLGWLMVVLLLPVFTISFIRTMVAKRSNKANALVLGIYTVVDAILVWLLIGAALHGPISVVMFLAAVGAAFAYNAKIMSFALRLAEE